MCTKGSLDPCSTKRWDYRGWIRRVLGVVWDGYKKWVSSMRLSKVGSLQGLDKEGVGGSLGWVQKVGWIPVALKGGSTGVG